DLADVELEPARHVPDPVPVLLGLLHAALLDRARPGAREHVRGVRLVRRGADPDLVALDPARERLHPPDRLPPPPPPDVDLDVGHLLRLVVRAAPAGGDDVPRRAGREAARRASARAAGTSSVSSGEKYVAAAYLVVFVAVLAWVAIISSKLSRLSREVS